MSRLAGLWRNHPVAVVTAAFFVAAGVATAFIWPFTDLIAAHDVGSIAGAARATHLQVAREAVRTQMLTLGAGIFAAGALVFTARNFALSGQSFRLAERGQVTDRYTRAVEQLGSADLTVRVGAIYALERIARDSAEDHRAVIDVLAAFIRLQEPDDQAPAAKPGGVVYRTARPDIQAALNVIAFRPGTDPEVIDLSGAHLAGAYLSGANFARVFLIDANLTGANLSGANLTKANLIRANLSGEADLEKANFTGALLSNADLSGASLIGAHMKDADLFGAILRNANFGSADLRCASFPFADLTDASLVSADLTHASFAGAKLINADLLGAILDGENIDQKSERLENGVRREYSTDLTGAVWPEGVSVPGRWELKPDRRLALRATRSPESAIDSVGS